MWCITNDFIVLSRSRQVFMCFSTCSFSVSHELSQLHRHTHSHTLGKKKNELLSGIKKKLYIQLTLTSTKQAITKKLNYCISFCSHRERKEGKLPCAVLRDNNNIELNYYKSLFLLFRSLLFFITLRQFKNVNKLIKLRDSYIVNYFNKWQLNINLQQ